MVDDLTALANAGAAAGTPIAIQSAYRSHLGQVLTVEDWVARVGEAEALLSSARPGHSEHQLGLAIDFRGVDGPAPWEVADWAATPVGDWLAAHAWEFGFVMSYPAGFSPSITCYRYEPWHFRWMGRGRLAGERLAGTHPASQPGSVARLVHDRPFRRVAGRPGPDPCRRPPVLRTQRRSAGRMM